MKRHTTARKVFNRSMFAGSFAHVCVHVSLITEALDRVPRIYLYKGGDNIFNLGASGHNRVQNNLGRSHDRWRLGLEHCPNHTNVHLVASTYERGSTRREVKTRTDQTIVSEPITSKESQVSYVCYATRGNKEMTHGT